MKSGGSRRRHRHSTRLPELFTPGRERKVSPRLRSETKDVPVRIFHSHLVSPPVIPRGVLNPRTAGLILLEESLDILNADPDPRSGFSLAASAKVDPGIIAPDVREIVVAPLRILESQHIEIVPKAHRHIVDLQNRDGTLEPSPRRV